MTTEAPLRWYSVILIKRKGLHPILRNNIRYRTANAGSVQAAGNINWGVKGSDSGRPGRFDRMGLAGIALGPISFTMTYLEKMGADKDGWKDWWCSAKAKVYQFIGVDIVYFYGPAEMRCSWDITRSLPAPQMRTANCSCRN
jgi:methionyl-tRNA synthetase